MAVRSSPVEGVHWRVSNRRGPGIGDRISQGICGFLVGVAMVVGASTLLFWNEGRSVYTYDVLVESKSRCNPLKSSAHVYESLDNKLVYLSGVLGTAEPGGLQDESYGVRVNAVKLKRHVEMYQWEEERRSREFKEPDGSITTETEYSYRKVWRGHLINSRPFDDIRYENPRQIPVEAVELKADKVRAGEFTLAPDIVEKIANWHKVDLNVAGTTSGSSVQLHHNMLYHGDPNYPQVGDVRVWFQMAGRTEPGSEDEISIVAKQLPGGVLTTFPSHIHPGYNILYVYMEKLSMDEVFTKELSFNTALTWALRGLGLLIMFIGFVLAASLLTLPFSWIPIIAELAALSSIIISLVLSSSLTLVIVAVAWLHYRPIYAMAVLLGACIPFLIPKLFTQKERND